MSDKKGVADRFRWHRAARLVTEGGVLAGPGAAASLIDPRPAGPALQAALAAAAAGLPFRIGGEGPAPEEGSAPAFETLTSGSSGSPRRIRRSQASWMASFAVNAGLFGIGPGVAVAVPGQLVQSLALYGALEALHLGATLHLLDAPRPDRQRRALAPAQVLYASPAQLRLLAEAPGPALPGLRLILTGGAKLDTATRALAQTLAPGAAIREFYGAAETSFITLADPASPEDSVGRPYPGVTVELRDAAGQPAPQGEVWLRSPYLFEGYAGDPGPARWQDGWLSVGEVGRIEGGCLFLLGRAGRMITVADQNVFPEAVETFLLSLPGVRRAAVLPRPDPRRGHVLEAVLIGGDDAQILAACRARFGPLASPRRLHRVQDWPLLPSGKTDLAALARVLA
jgi:long-chain acyl-CoA synthetase